MIRKEFILGILNFLEDYKGSCKSIAEIRLIMDMSLIVSTLIENEVKEG